MLESVWDQFLQIAKEEVGSRVVETWFKAVSVHRWDALSKTIYLHAPNAFIIDWIRKHYQSLLRIHLGRLLHVDQPNIELVDDSYRPSTIIPATQSLEIAKVVPAQGVMVHRKSSLNAHANRASGSCLNPNYVFDSFVVAPSNSLAYAAAYAVTEKPGHLYNPLFIYGRSGLGKTHLMHAIAHGIKERHKKLVVLYQSADRFVQEFISAIRFDTIHVFQAKYQSADVLLIDDIHFMAHKEQTQEAFFQLFNLLYDAQKQIVFSSDTFPQNMDGIAERLRSRLAWGLVTDVHMPSVETKVAILKKKTFLSNDSLPDDVADFIAMQVNSNIRELEGALVRILAFASLTKQPITLELAQMVLFRTGYDHSKENKKPTDFSHILKSVCKYYKYDANELRSKNRNKDLVFARHVTMFLMKKLTNKSLRDIGMFLGSRNHATVKHAVERIEEYTKNSQDFVMQLNRIEQDVLE